MAHQIVKWAGLRAAATEPRALAIALDQAARFQLTANTFADDLNPLRLV